MIPDSTIVEPSLSLLEWDSTQFGFPVGRINGAEIPEATLIRLLEEARDIGLNLVYWFSADSDSTSLTPSFLNTFAGTLITRKATFERKKLHSPVASARWTCNGISVAEYPPGPASSELVELGLAAGIESRFRVDPRFPSVTFERLYTTWVRRSTFHEISDVVMVAREEEEKIVGFVTVAHQENQVGVIGLIAVAASVRGRGVGRILLAAAHDWMVQRGLSSAKVVTQLSNSAACRLYERNSYSLECVEKVYHFWPQFSRAAE